MAWGDIRYDHSDIFSLPVRPAPAPPPKKVKPERVKFKSRRPPKLNKHDERRKGLLAFIEQAGDAGVTARQIKDHFGFKHESAASRAVVRLLILGSVTRTFAPQIVPMLRKPPFLYKVKR